MNATQHLVPTPVDAEPTPKGHATRTAPGIFKGTEALSVPALSFRFQVSSFSFRGRSPPARYLISFCSRSRFLMTVATSLIVL
jgi:hypothetical protein